MKKKLNTNYILNILFLIKSWNTLIKKYYTVKV